MLPTSTPSWRAGRPAACCQPYEGEFNLPRLVDSLQSEPHLVWLDSARTDKDIPRAARDLALPGSTGRYSVVGWDPWLVLSASGSSITTVTSRAATQTRGNPLEHLQGLLNAYPGCYADDVPPVGLGWLALLGYGLNRWIERVPAEKPVQQVRQPDLRVFGMRMLAVVDHLQRRSWCVSVADPHVPPDRARRDARERLEAFEHMRQPGAIDLPSRVGSSAHRLPALVPSAHACTSRLIRLGHPAPAPRVLRRISRKLVHEPKNPSATEAPTPAGPVGSFAVEPTMTQRAFETRVHRIKRHIQAGDIFQANLSQQFVGTGSGSPWARYLRLRSINPSPFACFAKSPDLAVVSCSPERLIQARGGWACTRPIAGTRPRGSTPREDLDNGLELMLSEKERAEHIMLVDLERNDLGRICRAGSVSVDELMSVEAYSHVMHIVSNVRGRLSAGTDPVDVIRALFPGGTITGCPKVRCMEILHGIEPVGRGLYTGSAGWIGFNGEMDLNLLIRTIVEGPAGVSFHAGAGIVADSQPDREYHETLAKARALMLALQPGPRVHAAEA